MKCPVETSDLTNVFEVGDPEQGLPLFEKVHLSEVLKSSSLNDISVFVSRENSQFSPILTVILK